MDLLRRLTEGVGAWLQFETHCNRRGLFSERYLSWPIGQILGAVYGSHVLAEVKHPILASAKSGRGAKPRIDFGVLDDQKKIKVAVESKWIGRSVPSVESVLWDIVRLELLVDAGAIGIFLLGGTRRSLEAFFKREDFTAPANYSHRPRILPPRAATPYLFHPAKEYRWPLHKAIFRDWQESPFAEKVMLRPTPASPAKCTSDQYQVQGWEVVRLPRRTTFKPRQCKHYRVRTREADPVSTQPEEVEEEAVA